MTFERTTDVALIKSVLTHPKIYPHLFDDDKPPADEWTPTIHPLVGYTLIKDGEEVLGIFIVSAHSRVKWEAHNAMLPHLGWKKRLQVAREFIAWVESCGCRRLIGRVPAYNRYAFAFNLAIGMELVGIENKSFMKNGELIDEMYFGLSLPLRKK